MTDRPVPVPRGEEKHFFEAARDGHLAFQVCEDCGTRAGYPHSVCPHCLSDRLRWERAAGSGRIYSFTTLHRAGHPALADRVPYTVVLVDLDEGVRILADLVEPPGGSAPAIGLHVDAVFEELSPEISIPRFRISEVAS